MHTTVNLRKANPVPSGANARTDLSQKECVELASSCLGKRHVLGARARERGVHHRGPSRQGNCFLVPKAQLTVPVISARKQLSWPCDKDGVPSTCCDVDHLQQGA